MTDKFLKEYIIPYSDQNLERIEKIASYRSSLFQNIASYSYNPFEIHIHLESLEEPFFSEDDIETLSPETVERLFLLFIGTYYVSKTLKQDFIDFSKFQVLPGGLIRFPIFLSIPTGKKELQLHHYINPLKKHPHIKQLAPTEGDYSKILNSLSPSHFFRASEVFFYRLQDFNSSILDSYSISRLKTGSNLKIKINTRNSLLTSIIRDHLYKSYIKDDVCFMDVRDESRGLINYLVEFIKEPQSPKTGEEDFVTLLQKLKSFLKQSSFTTLIIMTEYRLSLKEAKFIDYLLEFLTEDSPEPGIPVVFICLDPTENSIRFDLELNENPVNLMEKFIKLDSDSDNRQPVLTTIETKDKDFSFPDYPYFRDFKIEFSYFLKLKEYYPKPVEFHDPVSLSLIKAFIGKWEKEYDTMKSHLAEVETHIANRKDEFQQETIDLFHYLSFVLAEKETDKKNSDKHLKHIKSELYLHRASLLLCDRLIYGGEPDKAERLLEEAKSYFASENFEADLIETRCQMAKLYRERRDFEKAEKLYQNTFIESETGNHRLLSAYIAIDMGNLYIYTERPRKALIWYHKAQKLFQNQQNQNGIHLALSNLADIEIPEGNWQEAKLRLETVLVYDKQKNAILPTAFDYYNLARLEYLKYNFPQALDYIHQSIAIFESVGNTTYTIEAIILKLKIIALSKNWKEFNRDSFAHYYRFFSGDQKISIEILESLYSLSSGKKISFSSASMLTEQISTIQSSTLQFELITIALEYLKSHELLDRLKSLSILLSKEKKDYYYYEYYYMSFVHFIPPQKWQNWDSNEADLERFHDVYYFFYKNQRILGSNILHHKQRVDERLSLSDIFKSAELVEEARLWKIPDDFFYSLSRQIYTIFKTQPEFIKLVIFETEKRESPLFTFSTHNTFNRLTEEMVAYAIHKLEPIRLTPEAIKEEPFFTCLEKKLYFCPATHITPWKISEDLAGVLIIAFPSDIAENLTILLQDLLKKFASLIHRYYEKDFKLNQKLDFIIGESTAIKRLKEQILKVSNVNFSVLIRGESGTGKELVAKAIHLLSNRAGKPFIAVNAAAIPENLLEAELFGYKKGAFTGAVENKTGLIESAERGTLFLDEIADLPLNLQAKLLRALQENEIRRLGDTKTIPVDFRLISATNKNLEEAIRLNNFREDLFFRIQDLTCVVPPLRDRLDDIPLLVNHFFKKYGFTLPGANHGNHVITSFKTKNWPGNIRELEASVKRWITYYPDFEPDSTIPLKLEPGLIEARENFEKNLIINTLKEKKWSKNDTASALKITRQYLFDLIKRYEIKKESHHI